MQLRGKRLLGLFAQELRRSPLTDPWQDMLAAHSSSCAKIRFAITSLSTALLRLRRPRRSRNRFPADHCARIAATGDFGFRGQRYLAVANECRWIFAPIDYEPNSADRLE